ncbi:MAG: sigma-54-dependent Fis family transcriptional regulator [Myxococcales bacterium]|nr:sigma-54-dependent Fis family transcriptional regulator [Myxococcales bacterium]
MYPPANEAMLCTMDALLLDDVSESLWRQFHSGGERSANSARSLPHIARWERALDLGAPRDGGRDDHWIERGESLGERTERVGSLLVDGRAMLDGAAGVISERDFVLLVSDSDGVIVFRAGGGAFEDESRRVRLIEGAHWSERARGTNAIGTAISEQRATVVRGHAHSGQRFHNLVCSAAPVRGPDGSVLAVVDATSFVGRADVDVSFVVRATARALEEVLRARAFASAGAAVARTLARSIERMSCPALVVELGGTVRRANAAARRVLGVGDGHPSSALGLRFDDLCGDAARGAVRSFDRDGQKFVLRSEAIVGPDGLAVAVLVLFERASRPSSSPARAERDPFEKIFAEDATLLATLAKARRFARTDVPVVLLGETGSGKELVAKAVHDASRRAAAPFVALNCGAVAPQLLEAELFGAAPHAFTGADPRGRPGLFEAAHGGTLFLDEVAEMPLAMQSALLRVLESGELRRVGEARARSVDVRLLCATCRDLEALVREGRFRSDLFYRLRGVALTLPPLRARTDRVALARHLLERRAPELSLSPCAEEAIERHPWPGNVRELRSAIDVAIALAENGSVEAEHFAVEFAPDCAADDKRGTLTDVEGSVVRRALAEVAGNVSAAAKQLGVARSTLYRMMRKHGIG